MLASLIENILFYWGAVWSKYCNWGLTLTECIHQRKNLFFVVTSVVSRINSQNYKGWVFLYTPCLLSSPLLFKNSHFDSWTDCKYSLINVSVDSQHLTNMLTSIILCQCQHMLFTAQLNSINIAGREKPPVQTSTHYRKHKW